MANSYISRGDDVDTVPRTHPQGQAITLIEYLMRERGDDGNERVYVWSI